MFLSILFSGLLWRTNMLPILLIYWLNQELLIQTLATQPLNKLCNSVKLCKIFSKKSSYLQNRTVKVKVRHVVLQARTVPPCCKDCCPVLSANYCYQFWFWFANNRSKLMQKGETWSKIWLKANKWWCFKIQLSVYWYYWVICSGS